MSAPLPVGPPATTLRVYEPLEAFEGEERAAWQEWLSRRPDREAVEAHERRVAWRHVVRPRAWTGAEPEPRLARVHESEGAVLLCPVQLPLRFAAAARDAARTLPAALAAALPGTAGPDPAPGDPADDVRLRTLVAVWDVPWAWLVLVRPGDRRPGALPGYVVPMATARSRAARALRVLRGPASDTGLDGEVESVARWLEDFHPRSVVEVDDAAIVTLLGDDGADDVRLGLEALELGEVTAVAAAYRRLAARGERLRLLSRAS